MSIHTGFIDRNIKIEEEWEEKELVNPVINKSSKRVLKKSGDPIDIHKIKEYLNLINWSVNFRGCDHYVIVNHKGQWTNIKLYACSNGEEVEIRLMEDSLMFGGEYTGFMAGDLSKSEWRLSDHDTIFVSFKGVTLFLNNHDKVLKHWERYLRMLPKEFVGKGLCKYCGTVIKETRKMSALYYVLNGWKIGMTSPLASQKECPGCHNTVDGMSFGIDIKYYRIKTNRQVSTDTIGKIGNKHLVTYNKLVDRHKEKEGE